VRGATSDGRPYRDLVLPASECLKQVVAEHHACGEPPAMNIATIGLDLAKHWFQVHGVDERR
jgi:hypothetical protein